MKIMLTGGTGFIGSAVLDHLVEAGHQVTAVVRNQASSLAVEKAGAVGVIGDLFNTDWLASELSTHDAGIHTAAGSDDKDPALNDAVLDAAISAFADTDKPFVHTGGIWSYGTSSHITETSPVAAPELTAWRAAGERRLLDSGVRASVVQPAVVYGRGAGIPAGLTQGPLPGTGEQHWTTVHVDDLADLYVRTLEAPGGHTYIAASGHNPTVREIGEALGGEPTFAGDAATLDTMGAFGEALLLDQQADGAKAKSLGWQPSRPSLLDELASGYRTTS